MKRKGRRSSEHVEMSAPTSTRVPLIHNSVPPTTRKGVQVKTKIKEENKTGKRVVWKKSKKTTAPRIPAWSPTVVLTRRHSG